MSAGRLRHLDGYRGLAIALVIVGHLGQERFGLDYPLKFFSEFGVQCFFGLSGYLITSLLCREEAQSGRVDLRAFVSRRALRLLPALFAYMAVLVALKAAGLVTDMPWKSVAASVLYVRNVFGTGASTSHLWSLSLEEQFYVLWPFTFVLVKRHRANLAIAFIVAVTVLRSGMTAANLEAYSGGSFYMRPWFRLDSIMAGCALALVLLEASPRAAWVRRVASASPAWCAVALVGFTAVSDRPDAVKPIYLVVQLALSTWLLAHLVVAPRGVVGRALSKPAWMTLGTLSYSLYLWQQPFCFMSSPSWGILHAFPVNLAAAFACAYASHRLVEQPFLKLKGRFERAALAPASPAPDAKTDAPPDAKSDATVPSSPAVVTPSR